MEKRKTEKKQKNANVTVSEVLFEKIASLKSEGRESSARNYRSLLHYLENHYGLVNIRNVTPAFVAKLKTDLQREGKSQSTISFYMSMLRTIYHYCEYRGYTKGMDFPFRRMSFEIDKPAIPKMTRRTEHYLTKTEMGSLHEYWKEMPTNRKTQRNAKRLIGVFLLSYLCNGANLADLARLTYNRAYFESGEKVLTFIRHKVLGRTDAMVTVPIIPQLRELMEYVCEAPAKDTLLLEWLFGRCTDDRELEGRIMTSNAYISRVLRKHAEKAGIRTDVSFTFARHSYSTVMHHAGVPFAIVEQNLGHSGTGVAFNYIAHATPEELYRYNLNLL